MNTKNTLYTLKLHSLERRVHLDRVCFGVSPAFYISIYGTSFTIEQVCESLEQLSSLGFDYFQPEVYYAKKLDEWVEGGAQKVAKTASLLGMKASQFVAHFMMDFLLEPENFASDKGASSIQKIIKITSHFPDCRQITIPIGGWPDKESCSLEELEDYRNRLFSKLAEIGLSFHQAGFVMALEILPNSLLDGMRGFEELSSIVNEFPIALNFDTGHARASGEDVLAIPGQYKNYIIGTHLCDNFGRENLSLRPGAGSIPWKDVIRDLLEIENLKSLDIEIHCQSNQVKDEYLAGKQFLSALIKEFHFKER